MYFTEEQAVEVKAWIVKRIEDISDADSDVLADYVLALLRSDAPDEEIRKNSIENLEDFLKPNTEKFVNDIFETWGPKPPPSTLLPSEISPKLQNVLPTGSATAVHVQGDWSSAPQQARRGGLNPGRKRSFNDEQSGAQAQGGQYNRGERTIKAPRGRRGRDDRFGARGGHGQSSPAPMTNSFPPPSGGNMSLPPMPPGFPIFDPNDPMGAMMAFQAMGFPPMPGMPSQPQAGSPPVGRPSPGASLPPRIKQRCKDYDTKGFCVLGSTCPYEHGNDHLVAPGKAEEYDPANAMLDVKERQANGTSGNAPPSSRGSDRSRGRGRGRGDRGGFSQKRNRAEFSDSGPNEDRSITTIVVEQIPEDKFDSQTVRDFFSEFGTVVDVTMQPYKRLALVKYDDYAAARRAWESPKVIFDNRFVKVYWYKPQNKTANGHAAQNGSNPAKAAKPAEPDQDEPMFDREQFERQQADAQKAHEEKLQQRKKMEEERETLMQKKQEMAKKHDEEKAALLAKIAAKEAQKVGDAGSSAESVAATGESKDNPTAQILRKTLAELEAEAKSLGIDPDAATEDADTSWRGRGRGRSAVRGRYAPRGRGYGGFEYPRGGSRGWGAPRGRGGVMRLDNRPKKVAISGVDFDTAKDEALRRYLLVIGEYDSIEANPERADSQIVAFKERYLAEKLMHGKQEIPGIGKVEMSWVNSGPARPSTPPGQQAKDGEDTQMGEDSPMTSRKEGMHDVDYDVAEEDDWGRIE